MAQLRAMDLAAQSPAAATQAAVATQEARSTGAWWRVLLVGLALYVVGVVVLAVSGNLNLFPTVVLLGNFLVPVAYVAFFYERRHMSTLNLPSVAMAFFYGGVLGAFAASLLEPLFVSKLDPINALKVGFIEEFAKILGVFVVARHRRHDTELDGLILGAAAGMGFAALESTGYAFTVFLLNHGSLTATVAVTLFRSVLAPLGHGTWTAILASVLFRESGPRRFHFNWQVLGTYVTVSVLHGLWDGLPGLIDAIFGSGFDALVVAAVIAAVSLFILWRRWREAVRLQLAQIRAGQLDTADTPVSPPALGPETTAA